MLEILNKHKSGEKINKLLERNILPNLILCGNAKSTIAVSKYILRHFHPEISKIYLDERIEKIKSKVIKIPIFYSSAHIEIMVSDFGYNTKTLLPKLLLEMASTKNVITQEHKIIILHGVENLPKQTQYILRGNFELIMKNCRVILLTQNIHKLIEPLQSRCLDIFIPNLFPEQNIILNKLISENNEEYQLYENIIDNMIKNLSNSNFQDITKTLYLLMSKNISPEKTIKRILYKITDFYPNINIDILYEYAAEYDARINVSSRNFIHLQAFIIEVKNLLQ